MTESADKVVRLDGQRITHARELRRITKRELASQVGVSEGVVADWESKGVLRGANFARLCECLGFPPGYFLQRSSSVQMTTPWFRQLRATDSIRNTAQAAGYGRLVGEFLRVLERTVGLPDLRVPFIPASSSFDPQEIRSIAEHVRRELNLGLTPIVNVARAVEDAGVVLCFAGFMSRGIDSFAAYAHGRPIVVLNASDPLRLRFDVLHELGHVVMHSPDPNEINLAKEVQIERLRVRESQANRFASEMLMPATAELEEDLRSALKGSYWMIAIHLKSKWGASLQAMVRRGRELELISQDSYDARMKDITVKRWKQKEPGGFQFPEAPSLLWNKYQELKSIHPDTDERLLRDPGISQEFIKQITARAPRAEPGAA